MAVKIRLRRIGSKKQPSYRIVVADSRSPRDGKFIEVIGHYNPRNKDDLILDIKKAEAWQQKGAQPTETVYKLIKRVKNQMDGKTTEKKETKGASKPKETEEKETKVKETKVKETKEKETKEKETEEKETKVKETKVKETKEKETKEKETKEKETKEKETKSEKEE